MTFLRKFIFLALALVAANAGTSTLARADVTDPVTHAMKLYGARRYSEAAAELQAALPAPGVDQKAMGDLALGMIYTKNAALHRELARTAAVVQADYFGRLSRERGRNTSHVAGLYLGEALLVSGRPREAADVLERLIAQRSAPVRQNWLARVDLGLCYRRLHQEAKAIAQWNAIDSSDPEVRMALAASYSRAGIRQVQALHIAESALRAAGKQPSAGLLGDFLAVYARDGEADRALRMLSGIDLSAPEYTEILGRSKTLRFYSPYLLDDLAQLYSRAGIIYLEKAARDARLTNTANYYLGEAYIQAGSAENAAHALDIFLGAPQAPVQYLVHARVRRATADFLIGQRIRALGELNALAQQQPANTDRLAELLSACSTAGVDCPIVVTRALMTADAGQGRQFAMLNSELGRYYLLEKQNYPKAIWYMEAGRDKSNKNKIGANDPVMLVDLGLAYYRTMQYSENLEIYFEMSKEFPEVRLIQDAVQGVYVIVQRSAGDVKIF